MIPSPPAHSTRRVENNPDEAEHFVTMLRESPGQVDSTGAPQPKERSQGTITPSPEGIAGLSERGIL